MKLTALINNITIRSGTSAKTKQPYRMVSFECLDRGEHPRCKGMIEVTLDEESAGKILNEEDLCDTTCSLSITELSSSQYGVRARGVLTHSMLNLETPLEGE